MQGPAVTRDLYLPVAGALLRYRDEGCGPAVLLIHGWTLDLEMWEPQVTALADVFRLIRFDRRGFGLSSGRASLTADAEDALCLCDRLEIGRFACIGMSQGARVALHLCRMAPQRLLCLVLDGPPRSREEVGAEEGEDMPLTEYRDLIARGDIETFRRRWASHPLMQLETRATQPRALLERMMARYNGSDLLAEPVAPQEHWDRDAAISLGAPVLIVTGERDLPSRLRAADGLAAALPGAQRASISAARHIPSLDNSLSYNAVVRAFLERHAGSRH